MKLRRRKVPENKGSKTSRNEASNSLAIPIELIIEIFSRLPAKSVARCRCVSKRWASILRRPDFTESFFTRSSARPQVLLLSDEYECLRFFSAPQVHASPIVVNHLMKFASPGSYAYCGSVRGLVCFSHVRKGSCETMLVICNPSTGQSLRLSLPLVEKKKMFGVYTVFGYDPIQKQYKVLLIFADKVGEEHHVLTLGTGKLSWRKIDCSVPHRPGRNEICINGLLYYRAMVNSRSMLVCFDFTTEKSKVIEATELDLSAARFCNYNGKLALLSSDGSRYIYASRSFEMFVLEDPEKHEWSKHVYKLPPHWQTGKTFLIFTGVIGTNEIVLSQMLDCPFYVIYYNIEKKTIRKVEIQEIDAFNCSLDHICVDYVEDVQLMEMFRT